MLQENENLYLQLKAEKSRSKANKDAMFQENQRLLSQLAFSRLLQTCCPNTQSLVQLWEHLQWCSGVFCVNIDEMKR